MVPVKQPKVVTLTGVPPKPYDPMPWFYMVQEMNRPMAGHYTPTSSEGEK